MRRLLTFLCALCLALPALAERKISFGELDVHYSAFNSSFLQPEIANAVGLPRSKTRGILNVAVLKAGQASHAKVSGQVTDLIGKSRPLDFREVNEGGAIYYLAQFPIDQQEVLRFAIQVQAGEGSVSSFEFTQEVFPDP